MSTKIKPSPFFVSFLLLIGLNKPRNVNKIFHVCGFSNHGNSYVSISQSRKIPFCFLDQSGIVRVVIPIVPKDICAAGCVLVTSWIVPPFPRDNSFFTYCVLVTISQNIFSSELKILGVFHHFASVCDIHNDTKQSHRIELYVAGAQHTACGRHDCKQETVYRLLAWRNYTLEY
jgi:hypothetical protein